MNILILGDADSTFLRDYCKNTLTTTAGDCILLLSYTKGEKYKELYRELGIKIVYLNLLLENCVLNKSNAVPMLYKKRKEINNFFKHTNKRIDVIHMHYVEPSVLVYISFLWFTARKKILTFWGSDILRITEENTKLLYPFIYTATDITFMISEQYKCFNEIFGKKLRKKTKIIDMGNSTIDFIDELRHKIKKEELRKEFNLSEDKVVIHIGYNGAKEQQHLKIIRGISHLSDEIKKKCIFIFPWSYGSPLDGDYVREVKNAVNNDIDILFDSQFYEEEKLAKFRMVCDIFIYGQTTDAMSDSCVEYVYSGSYFLCPRWIWKNYSLFNNLSDRIIEYKSFDDLSLILIKILQNNHMEYSNGISDSIRNKIYENKAWKYQSLKWRSLFIK